MILPHPLFDTMKNLSETSELVSTYLQSIRVPVAIEEYRLCMDFLKSYRNSADTFIAYRREIERVLHWAWLICKKPLKEINRNDIRDYFQFVNVPPKTWIATKTVNRFIINNLGLRQPNPEWRPFVIRISKVARRNGKQPDKSAYQLSNKSIEAIFAALSSLFTFLQQKAYLEINPVSLIRQKKSYIQQQQRRKVTRKLSKLQWMSVINAAEIMAMENPQHERTCFLMYSFYLLGVRICELAFTGSRRAVMGNFAPDKNSLWWFTTVGKGNKVRNITVPDELLERLKQYRKHLGLSPLPSRGESTPLFPKIKGKQGLGTRQIRNIVQSVFNQAIQDLQMQGKTDEADDLATATVHWLRHTVTSSDVAFSPCEHIRDDAGHENPATMDKYKIQIGSPPFVCET